MSEPSSSRASPATLPCPSVVVVGAGPCGSALSLALLRHGMAVHLVESRHSHQQLPRGEGLMPSGLEALERLGLAPQPAAGLCRPLRSWEFWLEQRPLFAVAEPLGEGPPCQLIRTPQLLEQMLREARAQPAFRWHPGRRAVQLLHNGAATGSEPTRLGGVRLDDGTALEADLVVACDGRESGLRRLAALELREEAAAVEVLWFAFPHGASDALEQWVADRFLTLVGSAESLALYSPAGGGLRLGWLVPRPADRPRQAAPPLPWPERWARLSPADLAALWRSLPAAAVPDPVAVSVRPGLASHWQRPGLLLLGDAAHPMSPLRAQGLNMALRDAVVAAEELGPVLEPGLWSRTGADARQRHLDEALRRVEQRRRPEIERIQALQRHELARAELLRGNGWLRALLRSTAAWSGPLLSRRWQAGQPTLRRGLPLG